MLHRIALFQFHRSMTICRSRVLFLRELNPDVRIFGIYGGEDDHRPDAERIVGPYVEDLYHVKGPPRWKWQNTDFAARSWYAAVGQHVAFDVAHVVQWDLVFFRSLDEMYASVPHHAVGLTGLTPLAAIESEWEWTTNPDLRVGTSQLFELARHVHDFSSTRHACLGPGYCLPRAFLEKYSTAAVPDIGHDEVRLPLFAQILGFDLADTGLYPRWFDAEDERLFNAYGIEVQPDAIRNELARPLGKRAFHPCRELLGERTLRELADLASMRHGKLIP